MSNIGIMDPAFFVPKTVLIKWVNDTFELNYTKVEQAASGALHCQILDAIYPGKVQLSKVNFDAKHEHEFVNNYKVLQGVFNKENVSKYVDVQKLIKAKYQDNLEMLQWMKNFYETHYSGQPYNARERREQAMKQYKKGHKHAGPGAPAPAGTAPKPAPEKKAEAKEAKTAKPAATRKPAAGKALVAPGLKKKKPAGDDEKTEEGGKENEELLAKIAKLRQTVEGLEKERNFYFGKLREIEILCQTDENVDAATKADVLKILYQTDGDDEFQAPPEDGATDGGDGGDGGDGAVNDADLLAGDNEDVNN